MRALEARIKQMENDARRRDRELAANHRAHEQILLLKSNLATAKKERKRLMEETRAKVKKDAVAVISCFCIPCPCLLASFIILRIRLDEFIFCTIDHLAM